jgi:DNA gyrase/topoisomerase IV subunit B
MKRTDKASQMEFELKDAQKEYESTKRAFDDVTILFKSELKQFDAERIISFKNSLKEFLVSLLESQKEVHETLLLIY